MSRNDNSFDVVYRRAAGALSSHFINSLGVKANKPSFDTTELCYLVVKHYPECVSKWFSFGESVPTTNDLRVALVNTAVDLKLVGGAVLPQSCLRRKPPKRVVPSRSPEFATYEDDVLVEQYRPGRLPRRYRGLAE